MEIIALKLTCFDLKKLYLYLKLDFFKSIVELFVFTGNINTREP